MIYQWYHLQQKNVQGFLVTIGKNGTNSTTVKFVDFTIGRTPNVATVNLDWFLVSDLFSTSAMDNLDVK